MHSSLSSSPSSSSFYRCLSVFLMSPCLFLWHGFKPSHIIRESRASLLGFPSQLYNDLPIGLFWSWRRTLPANPAQLWPGSSPNRTHFVLDCVFGTSCLCSTPAADPFVFLADVFFFLHHLLLFFFPPLSGSDLFFRPHRSLSFCFSRSLFLSHFYWHFFSRSRLEPPHPAPDCLQKRLLVLWCMRAADTHLLPSSQSGGCF